MDRSFRLFFDEFLVIWRDSSLTNLKEIISEDFKAREVSGGEIVDYGYEESITGWEQGFEFVKENNAKWELKEISAVKLKDDERMVILSASIIIDGKLLNTANLFFDTFKRNSGGDWRLVRSYIEAGIPVENVNSYEFQNN